MKGLLLWCIGGLVFLLFIVGCGFFLYQSNFFLGNKPIETARLRVDHGFEVAYANNWGGFRSIYDYANPTRPYWHPPHAFSFVSGDPDDPVIGYRFYAQITEKLNDQGQYGVETYSGEKKKLQIVDDSILGIPDLSTLGSQIQSDPQITTGKAFRAEMFCPGDIVVVEVGDKGLLSKDLFEVKLIFLVNRSSCSK